MQGKGTEGSTTSRFNTEIFTLAVDFRILQNEQFQQTFWLFFTTTEICLCCTFLPILNKIKITIIPTDRQSHGMVSSSKVTKNERRNNTFSPPRPGKLKKIKFTLNYLTKTFIKICHSHSEDGVSYGWAMKTYFKPLYLTYKTEIVG